MGPGSALADARLSRTTRGCFRFSFQTAHSAVIVRLDRTIQYSRGVRTLAEKPLEYWMPAFAGMIMKRM
jgi:hypothetical protein